MKTPHRFGRIRRHNTIVRRAFFCIGILIAFDLCLSADVQAAAPYAGSPPMSFSRLAETVSPAVINIRIEKTCKTGGDQSTCKNAGQKIRCQKKNSSDNRYDADSRYYQTFKNRT